MAARHWSDLSPRARRLLIAAAGAEGLLKLAVLVDLRRLASEVRGPKRAWALAMVVNTAGVIPIAYFALGRRLRG